MMERKLICVSVVVCLICTAAVARPSKTLTSSGWTTESSHESVWNQAPADDSQGKGWVSSESVPVTKTKAVPTSWQQVDRHHAAKSSGWTNSGQHAAVNPPSQDIANGFVVHHPIPSSNTWNQSPIESWNKPNPEEYWPEDPNKKTSSAWEKAVSDSKNQWQSDVPKSSWDTKSAWEKTQDTPSTSSWAKNSSPAAWESDALKDRESAAGYAATGPAQYPQESDGWQKSSQPSTDAWKKDSAPSALYDAPVSKWNSKPSSGNSEWQKASSGWDSGSSDFKAWQKETSGWTNPAPAVHDHPAVSGWQQAVADISTQKPWQDDSLSNKWHKSTTSNGWNKK